MPPNSIPRKVEDIIFYYYSKLVIAPSSGFRENYGFIIDTYKRLKSGEIRMSDYERELMHLAEMKDRCVFCNKKCKATYITHLIPRSFGIKPGMHNMVYSCKECFESKGEKDFVIWWCKDLNKDRDGLPRVPIGLYLKIAYELHKINFTLRTHCKGLEELFNSLKRGRNEPRNTK